MKGLALALLLCAALLYMLAAHMSASHPAWGYVAAFGEAAMVGAIADWFAVVALFRHPLGVPVPHTAIIPSNKDRIGRNLADFLVANFLTTDQVLERLQRFDAARRLAHWMAQPAHAELAAHHLSGALRYALGALDDERVRQFFRATVLERLGQVDVATVGSNVLAALTAEGRHQGVLDAVLQQLSRMLADEGLQSRIAEAIANEVRLLRLVGLDSAAGRYAASKFVAGLTNLAAEMAEDPAHPLRADFDRAVIDFVVRLKDDAPLRERVEGIRRDLLASASLAAYLQQLWSEAMGWLQDDLGGDESLLRARGSAALQHVGETLQNDVAMQAWINEQIAAAAPRWIDRYRGDIRDYIVHRVAQWNAREMTDELERNIGRDLQFIRVNGTLVGGLVGLAIHALTQAARLG